MKEDIALLKKSIVFGIIFFIVFTLISIISTIKTPFFDIVVLSVVAAIFLYVVNYFSLNRTKKTNKKGTKKRKQK